MYEINKDDIEKKIIESRFSENEDTNKSIINSLLAITRELCDYTQEVNRTLIENAHKLEDHNNRIRNIYTVLLDVGEKAEFSEYESVGLYKMAEANDDRIFLDCEYDEIRSIAGDLSQKKTFKGSYMKDGEVGSFDYSLEFDNSFLKSQERVFYYAEQYSIKNPIVFSPFSHKSFFVKYDKSLKKDGIKLDFCYENNCIPVIEGKCCLYWNIRQSVENNKTYDAKEPYGDKTKYIYAFKKTKKGNLLLPLPLNNQTCVYDINFIDNAVELVTDHDIEDFVVFEYFDLDMNSRIIKERQSKKLLFNNEVIEGIQKQRRLLSEGDIERAIGCFREWYDISCEKSKGEGEYIKRYSKKYCVDRKDKYFFNSIRPQYIRFKKSDKKFLTDYANYILEYLEYHYPEIEWAGEV